MDQVPEAGPGAITGEAFQKALAQLPLGDEMVAIDFTNRFARIDSGKGPPQMHRRGHSPAHRYDQRRADNGGISYVSSVPPSQPAPHRCRFRYQSAAGVARQPEREHRVPFFYPAAGSGRRRDPLSPATPPRGRPGPGHGLADTTAAYASPEFNLATAPDN